MDLCMFTPTERKEVEGLVETYEQAREQLQIYIEKQLEKWGDETVADDIDARDDFMLDQMVYRYDQLGRWLCQLIEAKIIVSEIDEVVHIPDDE